MYWKCHFRRPRPGVERQDRIRIQVVAQALAAVVVRAGIAGRPVERVEIGVVGAGEPGGSARVVDVLPLPGLRAGLAALRHRPETPRLLARRLIEGRHEAADAFVAARGAGVHEAAHGERRRGRAVVLPPVGHLGVPQKRAREPVEGDDVSVIGDHEDAVAGNRHAAVDAARCVADQALRARAAVLPDPTSVAGVERIALVGGGDVHDPAHHDRGHLQARGARQGEDPTGSQPRDVALVDLVERAVAVAAELAVVGGPVRLRRHRTVALAARRKRWTRWSSVRSCRSREVWLRTSPCRERPSVVSTATRAGPEPCRGRSVRRKATSGPHLAVGDRRSRACRRRADPSRTSAANCVVVARGEPGRDARSELAAVAVGAVASGADRLVLAPPRIRDLREDGAGPQEGAEHNPRYSHD